MPALADAPRTMNLVQAVNDALHVALAEDDAAVVLGEDVGAFGGVFRATAGLLDAFGPERVVDTPLNESGVIGSAIGMALYGLHPIAEIQFADFLFPAFDQVVNELAKIRYRSGGELAAPVTVRTPVGAGVRGGIYHSQSPEALLIHTPGLKVVCPSTPYDAKGLLLAAVASEDPVFVLEPKALYRRASGHVPEGHYEVPLGRARVAREGDDVTLVAWGAMVPVCVEAATRLASEGIEADVVDPRTLWPLDLDAIVASVKRTGRAVIVHEAPRTAGFGAEIAALIAERCFLWLEAPVARVTGYDTPVPYALEDAYLPTPARVVAAVEESLRF